MAVEEPAHEHEDDSAPVCRICFGDAEDGRLISPCMCRGSVGQVHVECLNAWRNNSQNVDSFFRCDQCGYRYNVERTEYAKWLEAPEMATAAAVTCILLATAVAGGLARMAVPWTSAVCRQLYSVGISMPRWLRELPWIHRTIASLASLGAEQCPAVMDPNRYFGWAGIMQASSCSPNIELGFYRLVQWVPPWRQRSGPQWLVSQPLLRDYLDVMVGGVVVVGLVAVTINVAGKLRHDFRHHGRNIALPLAMLFYSHGNNAFRIVVAAGLAYAYFVLNTGARQKCRELLMQWGEQILEVQHHAHDD